MYILYFSWNCWNYLIGPASQGRVWGPMAHAPAALTPPLAPPRQQRQHLQHPGLVACAGAWLVPVVVPGWSLCLVPRRGACEWCAGAYALCLGAVLLVAAQLLLVRWKKAIAVLLVLSLSKVRRFQGTSRAASWGEPSTRRRRSSSRS